MKLIQIDPVVPYVSNETDLRPGDVLQSDGYAGVIWIIMGEYHLNVFNADRRFPALCVSRFVVEDDLETWLSAKNFLELSELHGGRHKAEGSGDFFSGTTMGDVHTYRWEICSRFVTDGLVIPGLPTY